MGALTPPATVPWTRRPVTVGLLAVGVVAFGAILGVLVVRYTGPAPPDPMMGDMPGMPGMAATAETRGEPAAGNPRPIPKEALAGMLRAAHGSFDAGRYPEARAAYQAVAKREPRNLDAVTHLAIIRALDGETNEALEMLDGVLAIDSSYLHALWDKARILHLFREDYAAAIPAWQRVVDLSRPGRDRDEALARIREAQAQLAATPPPSSTPPRSGAKP